MFGWIKWFRSRRLRKPVRLSATTASVAFSITLLINVFLMACKAVVLGIVPPPVKVDSPKPWLFAPLTAKIYGVKAWLYSMYSRWHIDTWRGLNLAA